MLRPQDVEMFSIPGKIVQSSTVYTKIVYSDTEAQGSLTEVFVILGFVILGSTFAMSSYMIIVTRRSARYIGFA